MLMLSKAFALTREIDIWVKQVSFRRNCLLVGYLNVESSPHLNGHLVVKCHHDILYPPIIRPIPKHYNNSLFVK